MQLNYYSPMNPLGYGQVGTYLFDALSRLGVDLSLFVIGNCQAERRFEDPIVKGLRSSETFNPKAPCLKIWHQHSMADMIGNGQRCGFPIFELDIFTPRERHHLRSLDTIFVTSQWAKRVVEANDASTGRIVVAPLGVDSTIFQPLPQHETTASPTVFLNCGKWEIRKGHDLLVDAFNLAFGPNDNVELWMMTDNPFLTPEQTMTWRRKYLETPMGPKVKFIDRVASHIEVAEIMNRATCGIWPSRAEGWNLEALEMMACGKHIIITDYSAHTEFCNSDNAHLISVTETEEAFDGMWFLANQEVNGHWASLGEQQLEDMVCHMRHIYAKHRDGMLSPNYAGLETSQKFTWNDTAKVVISELFQE